MGIANKSPKYIIRRLFAVVGIQFKQTFILPVIADSRTDDASSPNMYNIHGL
jgi:hypothetical protein